MMELIDANLKSWSPQTGHDSLGPSAWCKELYYDEETQTMRVEFRGGHVQDYRPVTKREMEAFAHSPSKGRSIRQFFGRES